VGDELRHGGGGGVLMKWRGEASVWCSHWWFGFFFFVKARRGQCPDLALVEVQGRPLLYFDGLHLPSPPHASPPPPAAETIRRKKEKRIFIFTLARYHSGHRRTRSPARRQDYRHDGVSRDSRICENTQVAVKVVPFFWVGGGGWGGGLGWAGQRGHATAVPRGLFLEILWG
jgi:hypothetical protein